MVYKLGRFGKFLACQNYPDCHNTKTIDKDGNPVSKEKETPEKADFACPECGGEVVLRRGRYGSFFACANYPKCSYTKQKTEKLSVLCPDCQSPIIIKHGKNRLTFYSCERYPECQFSSWDLPTEEKCPDCQDMLLLRKGKKLLYCRNKNCEYKKTAEPTD
jgi:DNA topoisomerase-1